MAVDDDLVVPRFVLEWSARAPEEARRLVERLVPGVDLVGRDVLAVGRGAGAVAIELAARGAGRVVALDMAPRLLALTRRRVPSAGSASSPPPELACYDDTRLAALADEGFDVVLASDAFRSYGAPRDSAHVEERALLLARCLRPGAVLAVRFGPAWRSPYGGGVDSLLPWAHLVFPEKVVLAEFRRVRPGSFATTFDDLGINRITLRRFRRAIDRTGLECLRFRTNVTDRRAGRALVAGAARLPVLGELVTQNAYGMWHRPPVAAVPAGPAASVPRPTPWPRSS